jgi:hypothetical protein
MTAEYSYFRAEGLSLAAVEKVNEARAELKDLRKSLVQRFNASDVWGSMRDDPDKYTIGEFLYRDEAKVPEGWEVRKQMNYDETRVDAIFAQPPAGSPDHFNIAAVAGLMTRAAKMQRIENALGIPDMPERSLPAGRYSGSFVRYSSLEDRAPVAGQEAGVLRDYYTFMFASNSPIRGGDPIEHLMLDGDWYLRVPNIKGTDTPAYTPPDAVKMDYAEMLKLDRIENMNRFPRPRGVTPTP